VQNKEKQLTINKQHRRNQMKFNKWTTGLAAVGVISLASAARADEKMSQVQTALSNTTISGYVDTAATWRPGTDTAPFGGINMPAGTAKNDGFSLNAIDIALDKPEDAGPWASGYHVELMAGSDAVGEGVGAGVGGATTIRQAYVTLRTPVGANGIDWKVGVFDTIIGYESSSDPVNPNYSRSYGWGVEPTTHTGILGTYKVNDEVTVSGGVADDSNVGAGGIGVNPLHSESQKAYLASIALTAPDSWGWVKSATLTLGAIDTAGHAATVGAPGSTSLYAGLTLPTPITALKVGAAFDYLDLHNGGIAGNPSDDSVWVGGLYTTYQATDKLSLNLRGEYLSNDGALPSVSTFGADPGYGTAEEATATVQYALWANVLSRVEFRWDHVEHGNSFGVGTTTPADKGNDFLVALNLIYQF
jgi:hypothetical protein